MKSKIRYEVEWCSAIPLNECGDGDLDNAKYEKLYFDLFGVALAYAKEILPKDYFGSVRLEEQEVFRDEDIFKQERVSVMRSRALRSMYVDDDKRDFSVLDLEIMERCDDQ